MKKSVFENLIIMFLVIPALVGYLFISFFFHEGFWGSRYSSLFFSVVLLFCLLMINAKIKVFRIEKPILAIFAGVFFFNMLGSVNSNLISSLWPESQLDVEKTLRLVNCGFLSMFLGLITSNMCFRIFNGHKRIPRDHWYVWDTNNLLILIYVLFVISCLCCVSFFLTGGDLVLLMKNPTFIYNSQFAEINPFILRAYYLIFQWLTLICAIYLLLDRRKKVVLIIFLFSVFNVVATGKRAYMLIPMITIIFCYEYYVRKISLPKLTITSFLALAVFVTVGHIRSEGAMAGHLSKTNNLFYQTMGEFSAFAQVAEEFPDGKVFEKGLLAKATILPILPHPIWALFGYNKNLTLKPTNPEIKFLLRRSHIYAGTRIGVIGELFLGFGFLGILVGMFIFGTILGFLNFFIRKCHKTDAKLVIYNFVVTIMLYSIVGEWNAVFSYMSYGVYLLTFIYFLCRKRVAING